MENTQVQNLGNGVWYFYTYTQNGKGATVVFNFGALLARFKAEHPDLQVTAIALHTCTVPSGCAQTEGYWVNTEPR